MIELWPVCAYQLAATGEDTRCRVGWIDRAPLGDHILVIGGAGSDRGEVRRARRSCFDLRGVGVELAVLLVLGMERQPEKAALVERVVAADTERYDDRHLARGPHGQEPRPRWRGRAQVDRPQDAGPIDDEGIGW